MTEGAGVPDGDPLKAELAASEQRGRSYKDEQDLIKQAGAFDGYSTRDQINDFLLSRDEGIRRAQGVAQGVAGGAGVAGGVALAGTGAATCAPTAGGGCAVAALGGVIAVKSAESGLDGFRTAVGPYQSTEGQRVKDSLDPETYPGKRDRAAELGMDGARSALGYGLGKLAGRLAARPAPVKGETSVATTASKAENELQSGRESENILVGRNREGSAFPSDGAEKFGANSGGRVVLELFGGKTSQTPGTINVDITATQGVRASATQLPFRAGIADEVIASNPYIPGGGGMMAFLPEAAQTLKPGGKLIINATQRNPFGILPDAQALENLGLRVVQENGPLLPRFESYTFRFTDGRIIPNTSVRTTILEKVK